MNSSQTIRYYGAYSNKIREMRAKAVIVSEEIPTRGLPDEIEVIDVSKYQSKKVPSLTWRECIKKIWKTDPLICPESLSAMKLISFITKTSLTKKILKYLDLWDEQSACDPLCSCKIPDEIVYVPIEDPA